MKSINLIVILTIIGGSWLAAQDLAPTWSQSYGTYDCGTVQETGGYSFGFGINNFCLYDRSGPSGPDTASYDERRFDLYARLGLIKNTEFELRYSHPTMGIIAVKYQFLRKDIDGAVKLGFGYMKGTRTNYVTDYVFDIYPTLLLSKRFSRTIMLSVMPKMIFSIHARDRQEHSTREPISIFQYGYGIVLKLGDQFAIIPETNWLFGNNQGVLYTVHQFGIGVDMKIK